MGKVILDMSMSLDGYIAGLNDEDGGLYNWYFSGGDDNNQKVIDELLNNLGAIVMGRQAYDVGDKVDGFVDNPYKVTNFVLTHTIPAKPAKGDTKFVFVTDGIESALAQAKAAAGDKDVAIGGGANSAQQYLKAGLIDEIQIHLVPVLLGEGKRLFEPTGIQPVELECTRVLVGAGVTHLRYRTRK
jgi:dihydrofolate reductase